MSNKYIIHTSTRVIRRVTTDDVPNVASDETSVDMGVTPIDAGRTSDGLGGWIYWKLDLSNNKVQATAQDVADSGADADAEGLAARQAFLNYRQALIDARAQWPAVTTLAQAKPILANVFEAEWNLIKSRL